MIAFGLLPRDPNNSVAICLILGAVFFNPVSTNTQSVPSLFCIRYRFTKISFIRHTPGATNQILLAILLSCDALTSRLSIIALFIVLCLSEELIMRAQIIYHQLWYKN